jgi:hypothetical protein
MPTSDATEATVLVRVDRWLIEAVRPGVARRTHSNDCHPDLLCDSCAAQDDAEADLINAILSAAPGEVAGEDEALVRAYGAAVADQWRRPDDTDDARRALAVAYYEAEAALLSRLATLRHAAPPAPERVAWHAWLVGALRHQASVDEDIGPPKAPAGVGERVAGVLRFIASQVEDRGADAFDWPETPAERAAPPAPPAAADLEAVESALREATPGEWEAHVLHREHTGGRIRCVVSARPATYVVEMVCSDADARAIVAVMNAAPAIIRELRAWRAGGGGR